MTENNRRKNHTELECVQTGFANGVAPGFPLTEQEKWKMVDEAEKSEFINESLIECAFLILSRACP